MQADSRKRSLDGLVALVTGANGDIGSAVTRCLAAEGARVAVNDRVPGDDLNQLANEVGGMAAPADIRDPVAVASAVETVTERLGPVDLLVANAAHMTMAPLAEYDPGDWWQVIDTNLTGSFHCIQAVLPSMQVRGHGRVVVVTSEWGVIGWPNATAYSASKGGLIGLTKSLGRELAPEGIIVNAVAPSVVDTVQLEVDARDAGVSRAEISARYAERVPLGRLAAPEEVAATIAFLADPRIVSLVGQIVSPNGGTTRARA